MVHCGQIKEQVVGECAVCGRLRPISFYSMVVCRDCHKCPECGALAQDCMQTESYICVASRERLTAVYCKQCGARWSSRLELDRAVVHQARVEAAPICRICGRDVYHPHTTAWGRNGDDQPCICRECLECPVCGTGALFKKQSGGGVECEVCKSSWATAREFEQSCQLRSPR